MKIRLLYCLLVLGLVGFGIGLLRMQVKSKAVAQVQIDAQIPKLLIFFEADFQGPSLEVTETLADMPVVKDENGAEFNWNDNVRSIIVLSGTWRLHENGRCNTELDETPLESLDLRTKAATEGWSSVVSASVAGPLRIANPAAGGFSHDVSSIELVSQNNLPDWLLPRQ